MSDNNDGWETAGKKKGKKPTAAPATNASSAKAATVKEETVKQETSTDEMKKMVTNYYTKSGRLLRNMEEKAALQLKYIHGDKYKLTNAAIYHMLADMMEREIAKEKQKRQQQRQAPPANSWQSRAAEGAYKEWKPASEPSANIPPVMPNSDTERAYRILEVNSTASLNEIEKAYKKKALKGQYQHPNKGGTTEMFQKLEEAKRLATAAAMKGGRGRTKKSRRISRKTRKNRS